MPTFGSLFAGIGGFDLGLERAGWTCRWQVEIDDFCLRVLARHWPHVRRYRDVREFPAADTERVDLICGGFPCQPVSIAGKQRAQDDARWLWPEFARVIRTLRPRYVFVENVPGLLVRGLGDVLGDLAACGYDAEWDCVPAASLGAHHLRDRVWLVAYPNGGGAVGIGQERDRHDPEGHQAPPLQERQNIFPRALPATRWEAEPDMARVADGLPDGLDRHRAAYGNAIVPQVAEWIGRRLMATYRQHVQPPPRPKGGEEIR